MSLRPRRSCLTVPGSSDKMIAKSRQLASDQVILDLEDSVTANEKAAARERVVVELERGGWGDRTVSVRVNSPDTDTGRLDLEALSAAIGRLSTVVVPKVESPDHVKVVLETLRDRPSPPGLEALIETAAGLDDIRAIARSSDALEALVFGPLDMGASLGIPSSEGGDSWTPLGDVWQYVRLRILVAARAVGKQAIDGPFSVITDVDGLRFAATAAAADGFDGKWVVHPSQIEIVNQAFSPTQEDFDHARAVLETLDRSAGSDRRGAIQMDGVMIDEASRKLAEGTVARGRAAGLRG
jgi:citrate lyase subunit beta / citryl-CoA lyase